MSVASKNLFDLLGNDDGDSDTPSGPVKTVDKTSTRTTKRNAEPEAPKPSGPVPNRRGGGAFSGSEAAAFRDRNAGQDRNRGRSTDEPSRGGPRGGHGARVRGGRGSRFPRDRDDRHSKGLPSGSDKQGAQTGATEGEHELKDEQVGEAIAETEQKEAEGEAVGEAAKEEPAEPAEPEDKHISYADYLAQQAEKKLALENPLEARKANEGSKLDKKWANAKELVKEEDDNFMVGTGGKAKRERERKTKQLVEIDNRYIEPDRPARGGTRGGRGGTRGGPRGDYRGGAGPRGGSPRGGRGGFRGGRDGGSTTLNPADQNAFPSLGS